MNNYKWNQNRTRHFLIGLAVALGLCNVAFSYMHDGKSIHALPDETAVYWDPDVPVTTHETRKEKKLPPPRPEKIIPEDIIEDLPDEPQDVEPEQEEPESEIVGTSDSKAVFTTPMNETKPAPAVEPIPETEDDGPILVAEVMPYFGPCIDLYGIERKSCSDKAIISYLQRNAGYTKFARENGIQGTVVARFVITKKGEIRDIEIKRDPGGGLGQSVLNALHNMPQWTAGRQNGRAVDVYFTVPVRFRLH